MGSGRFSIRIRPLQHTWLVLTAYSLLFFSDDGILLYGSIPTYLILLGLVFSLINSPNHLMLKGFEQPFLLFLTCIVLAALFGVQTVKIGHLQSFILMFLTYLCARSIGYNKESYKYLIWVFASFLFLNMSIMSLQLMTGNPVFFRGERDYLIPTGFSIDQHKNAFFIIISYAFIQSLFVRKGFWFFAVCFFVCCLFFLLVNTSRAGLVVHVFITIYILVMALPYRKSLIILFLFLFFGFYSILFAQMFLAWDGFNAVVFSLLPQQLVIAFEAGIMKYTTFFSDASVSERFTLWSSLSNLGDIDIFKILSFGMGPGSFDAIHLQTIHNTVLDILVSVGALGLLSLCLVFFWIVRFCCRHGGNDSFALGAVIVAILMFSMFHDFGRARFLWFFLGLAGSNYYRAMMKSHRGSHQLCRTRRSCGTDA